MLKLQTFERYMLKQANRKLRNQIMGNWEDLPSFLETRDRESTKEAFLQLQEDLEYGSTFGLPLREFKQKGYSEHGDGIWNEFTFQIEFPEYVFETRKIPVTPTKDFPILMKHSRFRDSKRALAYVRNQAKKWDFSLPIKEYAKEEGETSENHYEISDDQSLEDFIDNRITLEHAILYDPYTGEEMEDVPEYPGVYVKWERCPKKILKTEVNKKGSKYFLIYLIKYGPFSVQDWNTHGGL